MCVLKSLARYLLFPTVLVLSIGQLHTTVMAQDFDRQVAPIIAANCLECHQGSKPEGSLNLMHQEKAVAGGDSGPVIRPGKPTESLLWEKIDNDEMPPKHPLTREEKSIIKQWILNGAKWGSSPIDRFAYTTRNRAGRDFWSLQPLVTQELPDLTDSDLVAEAKRQNWTPGQWVKNGIDHFVALKLVEKGLAPSREASPRALIRRLYIDLIGLPPEPAVIREFEKDPSPEHYEKIVDRLLKSPHYGERWARHWLDVVRFGESDGFERNFPRKNAWPYRDWVIDAFNRDMPYDEFVRAQLIGDITIGGVDGAAATGFWVAGVHNTVVGGSKRMKLLARQDEIEEVLATVGQTFLGLTVNCARCHDHKYDPIPQTEFYRLASSISGLGFGEKQVNSRSDQEKLTAIDTRLNELEKEMLAIEADARERILNARKKGTVNKPDPPTAAARWDFEKALHESIVGLKSNVVGGARLENGALVLDGKSLIVSEPWPHPIGEKTLEVVVQLDDLNQRGGGAISVESLDGAVFDSIVFGEQEPGKWMAGSDFFRRTESFQAPAEKEALSRPVHLAWVYQADGTIVAFRNGTPYGRAIRKAPLQQYTANQVEFVFGLRHKPANPGKMLRGKIYSAAFYDRALTPDEIAAAAGTETSYIPEAELVKWLSKDQNVLRGKLKSRIAQLREERKLTASRASMKVYTLTPGSGAVTRVLLRGDPDNAADIVSPGAVSVVPGANADFGLPPNAPEAARRKKLAAWITSRSNPLFARVIVNRVWHYHFGKGIVDTPSDFGFNGGRPSHKELLDWLATYLLQKDFRLKELHRLIVTSAAYRQRSFTARRKYEDGTRPKDIDSDNRLLWRMNPRRLEAESIRDAILTVSGKLDRKLGGPPFEDVRIVSNNGTTYYFPLDEIKPEFLRRTIYRFNPRGGRSALLDTFDCPDPAATAPRRAVTTTPLQALSLLNNSFVLQMAEAFADRVKNVAETDPDKQIRHAWWFAIGRAPDENELRLSKSLLDKHGLSALCRALFNINEFVAIE